MNKKILSLALLLSASWAGGQALAAGEVIKLETYGTQYCAGKAPITLDPTNAIPFYAKVNSDTQITVFLDSALTQKAFTLPVKAEVLTTDTKGRVVASLNAASRPTTGGYVVMNGVLKTDTTKAIKFINVNFIRVGLLDTCSASGHMVGKRI
jgi:hypothetical protein